MDSPMSVDIKTNSSQTHHREYKQLRDTAIRNSKAQQYVRTNQFEVEASVNGLIEKFSVLNRDDLAQALKARTEELSEASRSKWTPEILSLFLNLSDRPVEKTNTDALDLLRPPTPPQSPITWEEILAEDPLTGDIWDEVSYSAESSEDELFAEHSSIRSSKAKPSDRPADLDDETDLETSSILVPLSQDILKEIESSQFWKAQPISQNVQTEPYNPSGTQRVSELQAIREVIFMLRGLPTSLFGLDDEHLVVFYSADIGLAEISNSSLNDILQSFANIGSDIYRLRTWARQPQRAALIQSFHASVTSILRQFDLELSRLERDLVAPVRSVAISLLRLHESIQTSSRTLLHLGELVNRIPTQESGFACLELLYDETCTLQASGDPESYESLARIFFECLQMYLRPVRRWIESGELEEHDKNFFVYTANENSPASSLWLDRYALRTNPDGDLYAPKFLQPAGRKILNAGKSIVFLRRLSLLGKVPASMVEPSLGFDEVCQNDLTLSLAPFSEIFNTALDNWVRSKYGPASSILCQQLFAICKLSEFMSALECIYFSSDGIRFQSFSDELFSRLDGRQKVWNDRFLLSELARSVYGNIPCLEEGKISVRTLPVKGAERSMRALSSISIDITVSISLQFDNSHLTSA
jgi:gamma-tubulin complex component 5